MSKEVLITAVKLARGQTRLADGIRAIMPGSKVSQVHVWGWLNSPNAEAMPPGEYVVAIAQHLDWRITPHELRPDLYPNPTDALPASLARQAQPDEAAA